MLRRLWGPGSVSRLPRGNPLQLVAVLALIAVIAVVAGLLQPQSAIGGRAEAVDGDTLRVGSTRIRLTGLDAPELDQTCSDAAGQNWACGAAAKSFLTSLVGKGSVTCARSGRDRYGRTLATCRVADADLGGAIVGAGWAVAEPDYLFFEIGARTAGRGIWAGRFEAPADWRRDHGTDQLGIWEWLRSWLS